MKTLILYVENLQEAIAEIKGFKGEVTQICTQNVIVSNLPDDFDSIALKLSSTALPKTTDSTSKLFFDAWHLDLPEEDTVRSWTADGVMMPGKIPSENQMYPVGTSSYMAGLITVGLVIVSGKEPQLIFSSNEIIHLVGQVMTGLQALASFEPLAKITFVYQINELSIDAPPPTYCPVDNREVCESVWRDPALHLLGCGPGAEGAIEHNEKLIKELETEWAYTAFFTKYPQSHFAYGGYGRVCMKYNDPAFIFSPMYVVFAHETSHVFGAADEYSQGADKCSCNSSGFFLIPNYNCEEEGCKSDFPKVDCVMRRSIIVDMCEWTKGQIGWPFHIPMHGASRRSPSITLFKDKLYVAFVANNNTYDLLLGSSSDGYKWTYVKMNAASKEAPSLAVFKDKLHVVFVANNGTNTLLAGSSADGVKWSYSSMDGSSKGAPSLTAFNNKLYVAFVANNKSNSLLRGSSNDGKSWTYSNMEGSSRTAPSLTVFKDKLHVAFVANNNTYDLLMGTSSDGKKWVYDKIGKTSKAAPSITVLNNRIFIAFVANEAVNYLWIGFSGDGKKWTFNQTNLTVQGSPSIVGKIVPPIFEVEKERHRLYLSYVEDNVGNELRIWRAQSALF